jgi:hypothetical protein
MRFAQDFILFCKESKTKPKALFLKILELKLEVLLNLKKIGTRIKSSLEK